MNINFTNFSIEINTFKVIVFLIFSILIYIGIFYNHHKRNKLNYVEISEIFISYLVLMIIFTFVLIAAFDFFFTGLKAIEYRRERYTNFTYFVIIVALDIWSFVKFIKYNLRDIQLSEKEENKKITLKIGEVFQLIFLVIIIFNPLWKIPDFLKLIENKLELIKEILESFFYSFLSIFLLLKLNPLDIKEKLNIKKE